MDIECFLCGICCIAYQPKLTCQDLEALAQYTAMSHGDFLSKYADTTQIGYLLQQNDRGCVFLIWEEDGVRARCEIYPSRPGACRDWVPSLAKRECKEGLLKLLTTSKVIIASDLYLSDIQSEK